MALLAESRAAGRPLTPKEWRIAVLAAQGVAPGQAARALGIAPGTLQTHRQAIRRKLSVPRYQPLEGFLRQHLGPQANALRALVRLEGAGPKDIEAEVAGLAAVSEALVHTYRRLVGDLRRGSEGSPVE